MAKNKVKYKKKPKTKMSFSNKKITRPKIKLYANKIYNLEKELKLTASIETKSKIEEIIDEICQCYEPEAMFYIDEEIHKIANKEKSMLTN